MPKHTVEFAFKLRDKVLVKEIQRPGVVDMIQIDNTGTMYRMSYWNDSVRNATWLYEDEIEAR